MSQICVKVRLFASYREAARTNRLETPLPSGARVADLLDALSAQVPGLRAAPGMVAVNQTYVDKDFGLSDGDGDGLTGFSSGLEADLSDLESIGNGGSALGFAEELADLDVPVDDDDE